MAVATIVTTVGSASANSYADASYAVAFFASRLGGDKWPSDTDEQARALLTAMRTLEDLPHRGRRATATQALEYPRISARPEERTAGDWYPGFDLVGTTGIYDARGRTWASTVIPTPIKDGQCEIAYAMVLDPSLNDPALAQAILRTGRLTIDHSAPAVDRLKMAFQYLIPFLTTGRGL